MSRLVGSVFLALLVLSDIDASMASDRTVSGTRPSGPRTTHPSFVIREHLQATVSDVDRTIDVVRLKTDAGRLTLHGPGPGTAATLREGDPVVVDVTLIRHADPARLPRRQEDPPPLLTQRLRASVVGIQRTLEAVALNTTAGRLTLAVPSEAIAGLRTGDALLLELAVRLEPQGAALPATGAARRDSGLAGLLFFIFGRGK
jgi:hypothetical protein